MRQWSENLASPTASAPYLGSRVRGTKCLGHKGLCTGGLGHKRFGHKRFGHKRFGHKRFVGPHACHDPASLRLPKERKQAAHWWASRDALALPWPCPGLALALLWPCSGLCTDNISSSLLPRVAVGRHSVKVRTCFACACLARSTMHAQILDSRKAAGVKYLGRDTRAGLVAMIKSHNHHDDLRED